ncbi:MAG: alpha/beta fold hydrolase [Thermoanaerobaculia bacterium]|nr:alpha/beta fold hydrolase [Thermoanaerobaculia bacterium]
MRQRELRVDAGDGTSFGATVFDPEADMGRRVILCGPAMGVRATYYRPLAEAWRNLGYPAVTFDLRGIGSSSVRAGRRVDFGYRDIVEIDLPAIVETVRREFPGRPIVFQGHSLSGQLACLHASRWPQSFEHLLLVATCSVYYKPWGARLWLFLHLARFLSRVLGHFPGDRLGFAGREARTLVLDWSRQGFDGAYVLSGTDFDYESCLADLVTPVYALHFSDDHLAPPAAVRHLLDKMPGETTSRHCIDPSEIGVDRLGHFEWVRSSEALVQQLAERLR